MRLRAIAAAVLATAAVVTARPSAGRSPGRGTTAAAADVRPACQLGQPQPRTAATTAEPTQPASDDRAERRSHLAPRATTGGAIDAWPGDPRTGRPAQESVAGPLTERRSILLWTRSSRITSASRWVAEATTTQVDLTQRVQYRGMSSRVRPRCRTVERAVVLSGQSFGGVQGVRPPETTVGASYPLSVATSASMLR